MGVLLLVFICAVVVYFVGGYHRDLRSFLVQRSERRRREQLAARLYRADHQIRKEANKARRDMNDAAGQSWRNRFE